VSYWGNLRRQFFYFTSHSVVSVPLYSGATHPRLTLYSGYLVTFLLSLLSTNHNLLTIQLHRWKVVNFTRVSLVGLSRLPGNPNRTPHPQNKSFEPQSISVSIFHRTILSTSSAEGAASCYYISESNHQLLRTPFLYVP
jgi:hypothetical protein